MLHRVIGRCGSGKTQYLFSVMQELLQQNTDFVVIVPEQQSLEYERKIFKAFGSKANMHCEVLNFERLPNRTYREYGGLAVDYIDDAGRSIIMSLALESIADKLLHYGNVTDDSGFVLEMIKTIARLKSNNVTAEALESAVKSMGTATLLGKKLHDIVLIFAAYNSFYSDNFADSCDALAQYAKKLSKMPFFKGKTVIIDSFFAFSEVEYIIIDIIAEQCAELYIALTYDSAETSDMFYDPQHALYRVGRGKRGIDIDMTDNKRANNDELRFLEQHCWTFKHHTFTEPTQNILLTQCESTFDESEAAASRILTLIREKSCRYKDIAVIMRSPDSYRGILDASLEKHGIPFFFAQKDEIITKPITVFLLSAVEAAATNYSQRAMKRYIKSGFSGLSNRQINLLSAYVDTWSIRGTMWERDTWLMNPDGFTSTFTKYSEYILDEVNQAKAKLMYHLSPLVNRIKNANAEECARALYDHLIACGADLRLRNSAKILREAGDEDGTQKLIGMWDAIVNILDQLYLVCPQKEMSPKKLLALLKLMCEQCRIGAIPSYCDAVTIGGASRVRLDDIKHVIILGANDGVFPNTASANALFNDDEAVALEEFNINACDTAEKTLANEKLYYYQAIASASDSVNVMYTLSSEKRASIAVMRLRSLFPNIKFKVFGEEDSDFLFSRESARENLYRLRDKTIKNLLLKTEFDYEALLQNHPLCGDSGEISMPQSKHLNMSHTRLDSYINCGFQYFGKYVLNLRKNSKAEFSNLVKGSFLHSIFETVLMQNTIEGIFIKPTREQIEKSVDKVTEEFIQTTCSGAENKPPRFGYIVKRLKLTAVLMLLNICEELADSSFVPSEFELSINQTNAVKTLFTTDSGLNVSINGKIDRVDICEQNGKKYIRITDYKTGKDKFSLEAVKQGLDLQLLIYLFTLCERKNALPSAAYYTPIINLQVMTNKSDDEVILEGIERTGIFIGDTATNKYFNKLTIMDYERLGKLKEKIDAYIKKISDQIMQGKMEAKPLVFRGKCKCTFCELRAVCRIEEIEEIKGEDAIDLEGVL